MSRKRPHRMAIDGLRQSDPTSLYVLTQDVLRQPLGRVARSTLADLFALSEVGERLPGPLARDLDHYAEGKIREIRDLPDGEPLQDFLEDMARVSPEKVPARLRKTIDALDPDGKLSTPCAEALRVLQQQWAETPPEPVQVRSQPATRIEHPEPPQRLKSPSDSRRRRRRTGTTRSASKASSSPPTPRRTPASQRDTRRGEWIREDVRDRLEEYGERGLKESILLAGTRHRSPWRDLTDAEILAELRALRREGTLRYSAGRWYVTFRGSRSRSRT